MIIDCKLTEAASVGHACSHGNLYLTSARSFVVDFIRNSFELHGSSDNHHLDVVTGKVLPRSEQAGTVSNERSAHPRSAHSAGNGRYQQAGF